MTRRLCMAEGVVWFVVDEIRLRLRATLIRFDADGDPVARVVRTPECVIPDTAADISARMSETRWKTEYDAMEVVLKFGVAAARQDSHG